MADTPTALTPDEASALEAIGGKPADTPAADPPPAEFVAEAPPQPVHTDEAPVHEHGNEGGALHSGDGAAHQAHDEEAHPAPAEDAEMAEMKSTMLDSAQLANRAAGIAAKSAGDMHKATTELIESAGGQKIYLVIVLAVFGLLIVLAISIFAFMSFRLQQRVAQADAMLLAVANASSRWMNPWKCSPATAKHCAKWPANKTPSSARKRKSNCAWTKSCAVCK
jgi:hypothetical protein